MILKGCTCKYFTISWEEDCRLLGTERTVSKLIISEDFTDLEWMIVWKDSCALCTRCEQSQGVWNSKTTV